MTNSNETASRGQVVTLLCRGCRQFTAMPDEAQRIVTCVCGWSAPILRGRLGQPHRTRESCRLHVFCPACKTEHTHGWNLPFESSRLEHRSAHCAALIGDRYIECEGSSIGFRATGYFIGVSLATREKCS